MSHHQNHNLQGVQRRDRAGVTLLFVVSMIVFFLLMGTAFVLVSNDFFRASKKRSTKHVFSTDHQSLVEQAFYDLLRGPELSDPNSPLRGHSLLADMYGYGFTATIASAAADSSGHFISLQLGSDTTRIMGLRSSRSTVYSADWSSVSPTDLPKDFQPESSTTKWIGEVVGRLIVWSCCQPNWTEVSTWPGLVESPEQA